MDIATFSIHQLIGLFLVFLILIGILTGVLGYKLNKNFRRMLLFVSREKLISGKEICVLIAFMFEVILFVILAAGPLLELMLLIITIIKDRDWFLGTSFLLMVVSLFQIAFYWCIYKFIVFTKSVVMTVKFKDTRSTLGGYYAGLYNISIFFILCFIILNAEIKVLSLLDLLSIREGLDELHLIINILCLGIYIISLVCYKKGMSKKADINYL